MTRRHWVDAVTADYAREALDFPGLRVLPRVDCETRSPGGEVTAETRFFARSLDPSRVPASRRLGLVRGHGQVENSLPFVKDRWWDENWHVGRRPGLAAGFTAPWSAALTVRRATGCDEAEGSMRGATDAQSRNIGRAIGHLTGSTL